MYIRDAVLADLTAIVEIYNQSISNRMATADTNTNGVIRIEVKFHRFHDETNKLKS